eukprot:TRINITY_DN2111_c0_g1_i2.p1 TRINITY_DN2111_c0_g1~~TRINITY_DN2111_c0_g1_i2.p1  ORF type:complete len:228 (+),score=44.12 TRINITY_DN2111_c0_g1_i2:111-794(+)
MIKHFVWVCIYLVAVSSLELNGGIVDTQCTVELVHSANSKQLHSILQSLTDTTFFRLYQVNTNRECPFWKAKETPPTAPPPSQPLENPLDTQCSTVLEDSAAPVCSLDHGDALPFGPAAPLLGPASPREASLRSKIKWTPPTDAVDRSISAQETTALTQSARPEACAPEDDNSPTFWLDICGDVEPESSEFINLRLNPERYTGYNGSHIWQAIYEENCFVRLVCRRK